MTADNYHDANGLLLNTLGITDPNELKDYDLLAGRMYAPTALAFAEAQPTLGMATLDGIHGILFSELYAWAGKPRTVPLHKSETQFADPDRISGWLDRTMPQFEATVQRSPAEADFRRILAELWGRLNWLHPYPEGNGRATQIFLTAVARRHGYDIDWSLISRAAELDAAIASVKQDFVPYRTLLTSALARHDPARPATSYYADRT